MAPKTKAVLNETRSEREGSIWLTVAEVSINAILIYGSYCVGKSLLKILESEFERMRNAQKYVSKLHQQLLRNNRAIFSTTSYEEIIAGDIVDPLEIDVTFDSIGGLKRQKQDIQDLIVLPLKRPDLFRSRGNLLCVPKGVLLCGVPGTGKTMLAKAIAKESGAFFINLKMSSIISKWQGETEKLIGAVFSLARKLSPCIIFVDEVDNFMGSRGATHDPHLKAFKTEFMIQWDGFQASNDGSFGVLVLGATNRPGDIDTAFLRRMPRTFEVGLPNAAQRMEILSIQLQHEKLHESLNLARIAEITDRYSGSDLKELCRAAILLPLRELTHTQRQQQSDEELQLRPLCMNDFLTAIDQVQATGQAAFAYADANHSTQRHHQQPTVDMLKAAMMAGMQLGLAATTNNDSWSKS